MVRPAYVRFPLCTVPGNLPRARVGARIIDHFGCCRARDVTQDPFTVANISRFDFGRFLTDSGNGLENVGPVTFSLEKSALESAWSSSRA